MSQIITHRRHDGFSPSTATRYADLVAFNAKGYLGAAVVPFALSSLTKYFWLCKAFDWSCALNYTGHITNGGVTTTDVGSLTGGGTGVPFSFDAISASLPPQMRSVDNLDIPTFFWTLPVAQVGSTTTGTSAPVPYSTSSSIQAQFLTQINLDPAFNYWNASNFVFDKSTGIWRIPIGLSLPCLLAPYNGFTTGYVNTNDGQPGASGDTQTAIGNVVTFEIDDVTAAASAIQIYFESTSSIVGSYAFSGSLKFNFNSFWS